MYEYNVLFLLERDMLNSLRVDEYTVVTNITIKLSRHFKLFH